jgi:hypothetical protein
MHTNDNFINLKVIITTLWDLIPPGAIYISQSIMETAGSNEFVAVTATTQGVTQDPKHPV